MVATARVLTESTMTTLEVVESRDGKKRLVAKGEFGRVDVPTENRRRYSRALIERELTRLNPQMAERMIYGELDHPGDGRTKLQRVSHIVREARIEGDQVLGELEVLETPMGNILRAIVEAGGKVGISSRGYGSTKQGADGNEDVQEDYRLMTWDAVADPATRTAYPDFFAESGHIKPDLVLAEDAIRDKYPELATGLERQLAEENTILSEALKECRLEATVDKDKLREEIEAEVTAKIQAELEAKQNEAVQAAVESALADKAAEIREQAEADLAQKFHETVAPELVKFKADERTRIREEMLNDPEVAQAKAVVEQIAGAVLPLVMPNGLDGVNADLQSQVQDLQSKLADRDQAFKDVEEEHAELSTVSRQAAYTLHMERKLRDYENADTIRELMKEKIASAESVEAVDEALDKVIEDVGQKRQKPDDDKMEQMKNLLGRAREELNRASKMEDLLRRAADRLEDLESEAAKLKEDGDAKDEEIKGLKEKISDMSEMAEQIEAERKALKEQVEEHSKTLEEDKERERLAPAEVERIRARQRRSKEAEIREEVEGREGSGGELFGVQMEELQRLGGAIEDDESETNGGVTATGA